MAHMSNEVSVEFELPSEWPYMQAVLPHLGLDEAAGYVMRAPLLALEGLALLEGIPEAAAFSIVWEKAYESRSGLRVPVQRSLWARAEVLSKRYTEAALSSGRTEWTARRVLVCALLIQARRLSEDWQFQPSPEENAAS